MTSFLTKLKSEQERKKSYLCVGLDPFPERFPEGFSATPRDCFGFLSQIIDNTAEFACAFKPQFAHFAAKGWESVLEDLIRYIREKAPGTLIVLDSKRGDIGSTAEMYAQEAFERYGADAVTVNPYMGGETVAPYLKNSEKGVFALCRTSNPGADELQNLQLASGEVLYKYVAERALKSWGAKDNLGLVVGATAIQELQELRQQLPEAWFLVPGVGAQGGDMKAVLALFDQFSSQTGGVLINASRSILYANSGKDFAAAAKSEAQTLQQQMESCFRG